MIALPAVIWSLSFEPMPTDWRDFEQLVANIERTLAPKGAVVKSPDRIPDLITGRRREVDASIRFNVGSVLILITVECRKRQPVQDDTWIEQLATKRAKIGAAKTIAVSATGFTDSAKRTAALYGIELRTLEDRIGEEIVQQFLSGFKINFIVTEYAGRSAAFEVEGGVQLRPSDLGDDLSVALQNDGLAAVVATEAGTGRPITMDALMQRFDDADVPEDGTPVTKTGVFTFPPRTVMVSTKEGPRFLARLELVAVFTKRIAPATPTSLHEYATMDKALHRTIDAVAQISENEGVRILVDIDSPALERRAPSEPREATNGTTHRVED